MCQRCQECADKSIKHTARGTHVVVAVVVDEGGFARQTVPCVTWCPLSLVLARTSHNPSSALKIVSSS